MITAQINIPELIDTSALAKDIARELSVLIKPQAPERLPSCTGSSEPFARLRLRLKELGMDHGYLAKKLGMYPHTLSKRMTGKLPWQLSEMYTVLDTLLLPYDLMHEYFPKGGVLKAVRAPAKHDVQIGEKSI